MDVVIRPLEVHVGIAAHRLLERRIHVGVVLHEETLREISINIHHKSKKLRKSVTCIARRRLLVVHVIVQWRCRRVLVMMVRVIVQWR